MAEKDALTPAQLKLLQKDLPSGSPYGPGKSPFKGTGKGKGKGLAKKEVNNVNMA
jgi:hypothetical protein